MLPTYVATNVLGCLVPTEPLPATPRVSVPTTTTLACESTPLPSRVVGGFFA